MTDVAPVLHASGLTLSLRSGGAQLRIVDDVTLSIAPGEFYALVGESGSGKTVLARAVMRLFPQGVLGIAGTLRLGQTDIAAASRRTMRELRGGAVSMVFQEPMSSLNPLMTVGAQIGEALRTHGVRRGPALRARILELLADVRFGAPDQVIQLYPHELSGGMRQRVVIAIALANRPALLIADEPTTALDVTIQGEIMDILIGLKRAYGLSVLFISHDLALMRRYADRVGVLYGGVLMEQGPIAAVTGTPAHPYTRALLDCVPHARCGTDRQAGIPGSVPRVQEWFPGCRFAPRCPRRGAGCTEGHIPMARAGPDREARCLYPL